MFHTLNFVIHYFQFVNFTHLFQPSYSLLGGTANWNIQCKPVGLPTKCSIELLVSNVKPTYFQITIPLTFEIFGRARNHGKMFPKFSQTSFSRIVHCDIPSVVKATFHSESLKLRRVRCVKIKVYRQRITSFSVGSFDLQASDVPDLTNRRVKSSPKSNNLCRKLIPSRFPSSDKMKFKNLTYNCHYHWEKFYTGNKYCVTLHRFYLF